jgi:large subunit ribosomal protein L13
MKTSTIPVGQPKWVLVDAQGQNLGRLAVQVATILRGKHRPSFSPHQLCGDHVVVINAAGLKLPPKKGIRKVYHRHTGHPGGLKTTSLEDMMIRDPEQVIERAVKGMIPLNRLRDSIIKRLHVFAGAEHTYAAQKPAPVTL